MVLTCANLIFKIFPLLTPLPKYPSFPKFMKSPLEEWCPSYTHPLYSHEVTHHTEDRAGCGPSQTLLSNTSLNNPSMVSMFCLYAGSYTTLDMIHEEPWWHWSRTRGFMCPIPVAQELLSLTTLALGSELDKYTWLHPGKGARAYFFSSFPLRPKKKTPIFLQRIHQDSKFRRHNIDYKTSFYHAPRKCVFMKNLKRNFTEIHLPDRLWQISRDNPAFLLPDDVPGWSWELPDSLDSYYKCYFGKLQSTSN